MCQGKVGAIAEEMTDNPFASQKSLLRHGRR
jgi:hypothetical protein